MTPTIDLRYGVDVLEGLAALPAGSVHCVVCSPPYHGLRSYLSADHPDKAKELGQDELHDCLAWARSEPPCGACFVCNTRAWLAAVWRVLRDDGCVFLNLGDSFSSGGSGQNFTADTGSTAHGTTTLGGYGHIKQKSSSTIPPKNLMLIPARVALAAQADGWIVRNDIIWHKLAPMPSSAQDRFTVAHENVFLLVKQGSYFFDIAAVSTPSKDPTDNRKARQNPNGYAEMVGEGGQVRMVINPANAKPYAMSQPRDVLTLSPESYGKAHFATFPTALARICILAGTSAAGCCAKCGKPWVREKVIEQLWRYAAYDDDGRQTYGSVNRMARPQSGGMSQNVTRSTGWRPTCTCNAGDPIPCTVLDPFSGSGTTAAVAKQCGRSAIGIDLNAAYLPLAENRVAGVTAPMVPMGYEDAAPLPTNGNGQHETQQELFA